MKVRENKSFCRKLLNVRKQVSMGWRISLDFLSPILKELLGRHPLEVLLREILLCSVHKTGSEAPVLQFVACSYTPQKVLRQSICSQYIYSLLFAETSALPDNAC